MQIPPARFSCIVTSICLLISLQLLSGCSARSSQQLSPSQLDTAVASAPVRTEQEYSVSRQSELLHNFIVGQLALDSEDTSRAYANLQKANDLVSEPLIQNQVARLLIQKGELSEAAEELEKSLTVTSEAKADSVLLLTWLNIFLGNEAATEELLKRYSALLADRMETKLVLAAAMRSQLKVHETLQALETSDASSIALLARARILEQRQQLDEAALAFELLAESPLMSREGILGTARIAQKKQEQVPHALQALDVANEAETFRNELANRLDRHDIAVAREVFAEPESLDAPEKLLLLAAQDNLRNQRIDLGFDELYLNLAIDPTDEARLQLATFLAQAGRLQEGATLALSIKSKSPLYTRARVFAALTLRQARDLPRAEKILREALRSASPSEQLETALVMVLREQKKYGEAKKVYDEVLQREPDNQRVLFSYGVLLQEMGKSEEALVVMDKIIHANPSNAEAMNYVAYSLSEVGRDLDRAEQLVQKALQQQPQNGYFVDTLAWVYYARGEYDKALTAIEKASALEPNDPEILEHYGDILVKKQKGLEAKALYDQARDAARLSSEPDAQERVTRLSTKIKEITK